MDPHRKPGRPSREIVWKPGRLTGTARRRDRPADPNRRRDSRFGNLPGQHELE
jgi:hypothetical protein